MQRKKKRIPGDRDQRIHVALFSKKCKTCGHLDPDEPKKYSCTFESGNEQCPAPEVQIVVVGQAIHLAHQVQQARMRRDPKDEAKILAFVSKQSEPFRNKFYSELERFENERSTERS